MLSAFLLPQFIFNILYFSLDIVVYCIILYLVNNTNRPERGKEIKMETLTLEWQKNKHGDHMKARFVEIEVDNPHNIPLNRPSPHVWPDTAIRCIYEYPLGDRYTLQIICESHIPVSAKVVYDKP